METYNNHNTQNTKQIQSQPFEPSIDYNSKVRQFSSQGSNDVNVMDPYFAHMFIMRSEMYILYNYPYLTNLNQKIEKDFSIPDNSSVFLIKSFTEEDIHKAIKYNVWSSTNFGNTKLNNEFKQNKNVYLLFSTYNTSQLTGLARMKTEVDFKSVFPLWARDNWRGTFEIEWLLIKDIPFFEFRNVKCTPKEKKSSGEYNFINYSTKSLLNSPDCQMLPLTEARDIIQVMINYQNKNSILEHFEYYDIRQANYEMSFNKTSQIPTVNHLNDNSNCQGN